MALSPWVIQKNPLFWAKKVNGGGLGSVGVELIPRWGLSSFPFFVLDPVLAFQWFGALSTGLTYLPALLLPSGG